MEIVYDEEMNRQVEEISKQINQRQNYLFSELSNVGPNLKPDIDVLKKVDLMIKSDPVISMLQNELSKLYSTATYKIKIKL